MFAEVKKMVLSSRKRAVKNGIPERFLALGDALLAKATFLREHAGGIPKKEAPNYERALKILGEADMIFKAQFVPYYINQHKGHIGKELQAKTIMGEGANQ